MSSLSQSRALAGSRAFTTLRPRVISRFSNGGKVFMRRNDSYMIEVAVGEEEPEDIAIRRYMRAVMDSKVLDQLRAKKVKESKIEAYKRRLRERHEIRKSEFEWPTWEEVEGIEMTPKVFDEFFSMDPDGDFGGLPGMGDEDFLGTGGTFADGMWGGYMDGRGATNGNWEQGGYMDQSAGYLNAQGGQPYQGGYMDANAGGYMNAGAGGYMGGGYADPAAAGGYADQGFAAPSYTTAGQQQTAAQYDAQGNFIYTAAPPAQ